MRPLLLCLPLLACMPTMPPPPIAATDQCGAASLAGLVGQPVTALPAAGPWSTVRVIKPGMMITQDYAASRLDVQVDGADLILAVSCG